MYMLISGRNCITRGLTKQSTRHRDTSHLRGMRVLAEQLFNDFRGACFYADPDILDQILKTHLQSSANTRTAITKILRQLLEKYASRYAGEQDIEDLANLIESFGMK